MAMHTSRPRPPLQDENASLSGKSVLHERKGLQQQGPVERKKLSNITNRVLPQPKLPTKGAAEKDSFTIRPDLQDAISMSSAKKISRPPLKNISNGISTNKSSSKPQIKAKDETKAHNQTSSTSFQLPPRSKLNLTDEMKKKAALWAEEGIERVHFSGEDMEKLRQNLQDEEIAKRVAMIRNCRLDIPFPRFPAPLKKDTDLTWDLPGDVLEADVVKDLNDDAASDVGGLDILDTKVEEELLGCIDYYYPCSPPRFTEGWPMIKEDIQGLGQRGTA